jgi:hypothetical protein
MRRKGELSSAAIDHGWPHQQATAPKNRFHNVGTACRISVLDRCPRRDGTTRGAKAGSVSALSQGVAGRLPLRAIRAQKKSPVHWECAGLF